MLNLSGKVRLGKVYLSSNYKDCHCVFSGTAKVDLCSIKLSYPRFTNHTDAYLITTPYKRHEALKIEFLVCLN